jgi:hypothetical protein
VAEAMPRISDHAVAWFGERNRLNKSGTSHDNRLDIPPSDTEDDLRDNSQSLVSGLEVVRWASQIVFEFTSRSQL